MYEEYIKQMKEERIKEYCLSYKDWETVLLCKSDQMDPAQLTREYQKYVENKRAKRENDYKNIQDWLVSDQERNGMITGARIDEVHRIQNTERKYHMSIKWVLLMLLGMSFPQACKKFLVLN